MKKICATVFAAALFSAAATAGTLTCTGNCGTDGTDGDVHPAPTFSNYLFVSTNGGVTGAGIIPTGALGGETDGSLLVESLGALNANSDLNFDFNYITSDGSSTFPDYAWAALEDGTGNLIALLFTAQTVPTGNTSPGFGLPLPNAILNPSATPIGPGSGTSCSNAPCEFANGGGPVWSEIGSFSGACWASGCGLTGWINADYTIVNAGTYQLAFGVTNYTDANYDSGLAIDGVAINGVPVVSTPEPSSLALLGLGLSALGMAIRRRKVQ